MKSFDMWQKFIASGKITDYLDYKNFESNRTNLADENNDKGTSYKREDSWGERQADNYLD